MRGPVRRGTHAAVVGVAAPDDPQSIALAAAAASLDLFQRIKVRDGQRLTVIALDIVEPVATEQPLDFIAAATSGGPQKRQAVVVLAAVELITDAAPMEGR